MEKDQFEVRVINRLINLVESINRFLTSINRRLATFSLKLRHLKNEILFGEREDDIYVASYAKSGTTWMQMIVYQLTTAGSMDFGHIYEVSPWLRNISYKNEPLPSNLPSPRIIKTHDPYNFVAKGKKGRFIFLLREGTDIAASLYHHRKDYTDNTINFNDSFNLSFVEKGEDNWFEFTALWLQNPNKHRILYIKYEDLKADLLKEAGKIAEFLGLPFTTEVQQRVAATCSFAYMKANEQKFGEQPVQKKHQVVYDNFIRQGETGKGASYLDAEQRKQYAVNFTKYLGKHPQMKPYLKNVVKLTMPASETEA